MSRLADLEAEYTQEHHGVVIQGQLFTLCTPTMNVVAPSNSKFRKAAAPSTPFTLGQVRRQVVRLFPPYPLGKSRYRRYSATAHPFALGNPPLVVL